KRQPPPVARRSVPTRRSSDLDEVKLSTALGKLVEEDASLFVEQNSDTHQLVLLGQGEMHLRVALERLNRKYGVAVEKQRRLVPRSEEHTSELQSREKLVCRRL